MRNKNIILKSDEKLYNAHRKYYKKKDLLISRQVEIMIKEQFREGMKK
jgi:hypothetical protein